MQKQKKNKSRKKLAAKQSHRAVFKRLERLEKRAENLGARSPLPGRVARLVARYHAERTARVKFAFNTRTAGEAEEAAEEALKAGIEHLQGSAEGFVEELLPMMFKEHGDVDPIMADQAWSEYSDSLIQDIGYEMDDALFDAIESQLYDAAYDMLDFQGKDKKHLDDLLAETFGYEGDYVMGYEEYVMNDYESIQFDVLESEDLEEAEDNWHSYCNDMAESYYDLFDEMEKGNPPREYYQATIKHKIEYPFGDPQKIRKDFYRLVVKKTVERLKDEEDYSAEDFADGSLIETELDDVASDEWDAYLDKMVSSYEIAPYTKEEGDYDHNYQDDFPLEKLVGIAQKMLVGGGDKGSEESQEKRTGSKKPSRPRRRRIRRTKR